MNAAKRTSARNPRGPGEAVALRDPLARPASRPRYEVSPRPPRTDDAVEQADRLRVARLIREPRIRKGMIQAEAARALGIPQTFLSAWERGKQTVPAEMRIKIATLYGMDPALFDGLDTASIAISNDERVLLHRFRIATEDERRAALKAVMP